MDGNQEKPGSTPSLEKTEVKQSIPEASTQELKTEPLHTEENHFSEIRAIQTELESQGEIEQKDSQVLSPTLELQQPFPIGYNSAKDTQSGFLQRAAAVISTVGFNAQLLSITALQFGGIHPKRLHGQWRWVVEPWADIRYDPGQVEGAHFENRYATSFKKLKEHGVKLLDEKTLPDGKIPALRPVGLSGLQYLDHHRIEAAKIAKLPIVVEPLRIESFR